MADRHGEADKESTLEPTKLWSPQVEIAEISSDEESNRRELAADRAERENRSAGNGRAKLVAPRESQDDRNVRAVLLPMIRWDFANHRLQLMQANVDDAAPSREPILESSEWGESSGYFSESSNEASGSAPAALDVSKSEDIARVLQVMQFLRSSPFHACFSIVFDDTPSDNLSTITFKCQRRDTHKLYAVKVSPIRSDSNVKNEVDALTACKGNRHTVDIVGAYCDGAFHYIVLELLRGENLLERIRCDRKLSEPMARVYFGQIVAGLQCIHSKRFVHRALSPQNVVITATGTLKIVDFGCAMPVAAEDDATEANKRKEPIDYPLDIRSLGILLYQMLCGCSPYENSIGKSQTEYHDQCHSSYGSLSGKAKVFIESLLQPDPDQRPTMDQMEMFEWVGETQTTLPLPGTSSGKKRKN